MKPLLRLSLLAVVLAGLVNTQVQGQASTGPTPQPTTTGPTAVPLDGGASLLLVSGVVYGLKCLRRKSAE